MSDGYTQHPLFLGGELRCQFERTLEGEYCTEDGLVQLYGLRMCERHAERLRLQERVAYWRAILAHIELWSGEAKRRGKDSVVGLLEVERASAWAALERADKDLQGNEDGEVSRDGEDGEDGSGGGSTPHPWWPPLLLLLSLVVVG